MVEIQNQAVCIALQTLQTDISLPDKNQTGWKGECLSQVFEY